MSNVLFKKPIKTIGLFAALSVVLCSFVMAQDPFTKITSGPPATVGKTSFGCAWIDYNNDDYLDLFVSNYPVYNMSVPISNDLYLNNGDGTFTEITTDPITTYGALTWCGTWADYDNDGYTDLYAINGLSHDNQLYHNNGDGTFSRITDGPIVNDGISSNGGNWLDYDNDGMVDLFVASDGYGGPLSESSNSLYRNTGPGTFTLVPAGDLSTQQVTTHSAVCCDYNNDGFMDLFVANYDDVNNQLLLNNGDGTFANIDAGQMTGDGVYSTGASWADYDNDGDFDLLVINYIGSNNFFYDNLGDGTFNRRTDLVVAENTGGALSSCFGDYDNDGDLDLFIANGDFYTGTSDNNSLYENNGDGTFSKVTNSIVVTDPGKSCGASWGDYDRDGQLDLYVARFFSYQTNGFYHNNGNDNNWIDIKCIGNISNKSAIGAKVRAYATINGSPVWQLRQVESQSGYACQNLNIHFGLGDASLIDTILIQWPSALVDTLTDVAPNQFLKIIEGDYLDLDNDGIIGISDNCPNNYNPLQEDADGDGIGDVCEINCCHAYGIPGDANSDGAVNLIDILYLIAFKYNDPPGPGNPAGCDEFMDGNGDGNVNLLDILYLISYKYDSPPGPAPICPN